MVRTVDDDIGDSEVAEAQRVTEAPALENAEGSPSISPLEPGSSEGAGTRPDTESGKPSPEERAKRTAAHWKRGAAEILACALQFRDACQALRNDPAGMRAYTDGLVKEGMLTEREGADPQGSAKLSCLRTMAKHPDIMQDSRVLAHVGPGCSKLALCGRIAEQLPGNEEEKLEGLVSILDSCPNEEVDRHFLVAANKQLKRERERNAPANGDEEPADKTADDEAEEPAEADGTTTWPDLLAKKKRFSRVFVTFRPGDIRLLSKELANPDKLRQALPLTEILAPNAVIVIAVEGRDLLHADFLGQLFREWGVKRTSDLLLARKLTGPRIGSETVLVTVECGDLKHQAAADELWAEGAETLDVPARVERVYSGGSWVHLFAEQAREGWTVLIGDDGWLDAPGDAE